VQGNEAGAFLGSLNGMSHAKGTHAPPHPPSHRLPRIGAVSCAPRGAQEAPALAPVPRAVSNRTLLFVRAPMRDFIDLDHFQNAGSKSARDWILSSRKELVLLFCKWTKQNIPPKAVFL
jgi:hypothetical protein